MTIGNSQYAKNHGVWNKIATFQNDGVEKKNYNSTTLLVHL